ncbi:MAG: hypothetical protein PHI63_01970 [Patescibacteria group bacterium]|nr:hypothetical protein [Patescibacteria group bacterium]
MNFIKIITLYKFAEKFPFIFFLFFFVLTCFTLGFSPKGWGVILMVVFGIIPVILLLDIIVFAELFSVKILQRSRLYNKYIFFLWAYSVSQFFAFFFRSDGGDVGPNQTILDSFGINTSSLGIIKYSGPIMLVFAVLMVIFFAALQVTYINIKNGERQSIKRPV